MFDIAMYRLHSPLRQDAQQVLQMRFLFIVFAVHHIPPDTPQLQP